MEQLAITSEEVFQALQSVQRSEFRTAVWQAFRQGELTLIAEGIISAGKATNVIEVIHYIADYMLLIENKATTKVTWGDITKTSSNRTISRKLSELLKGKQRRKHSDPTRYYGVIGHVAIPELFSGTLIKFNRTAEHTFFWKLLLTNDWLDKKQMPVKKVYPAGKLIDQLQDYHVRLEHEMETNKFPIYSKNYAGLRNCLEKIYGSYMEQILYHGFFDFDEEYLIFLTCLTWSNAVLHYRYFEVDLVLFKEVSILPYSYDLGAGRLDALSLYKIKGKYPNKKQVKILKALVKRKYESIGFVIKTLIAFFGPDIEFKIWDWKFAVGDGPSGMRRRNEKNIIDTANIKKHPLIEHERQLKRYISMAVLSYTLAKGDSVKTIEETYGQAMLSIVGEIVYLSPSERLLPHRIQLTGEEMVQVFHEQILSKFRNAVKRSSTRRTGAELLRHTIIILSGGNTQMKPTGRQLLLFQQSFLTIAAKYQHETSFKDPLNIIELIDKDNGGKEILEMHIDKLFGAIEKGSVITSPTFNYSNGGHIGCIITPENTPSMYVSLKKMIFKCFSCGATGTFAPSSIPDSVHLLSSPGNVFKRQASEDLVISTRHQEIMRHAQVFLQETFIGSVGEKYLQIARGLDPLQSYGHGVGFGTIALIHHLLDAGFLYDELIYYGLLNISPRVSEKSELVKMLLSRGLVIEQIGRPVRYQAKVGQPAITTIGLPYSVLHNRVTYPLEIRGIINTFYGRAIDPQVPKGLRHVKLPNGYTKTPHGAYNMSYAMQQASEAGLPLLVTEAPIDADNFMQMTELPYAVGIVGVNNGLLFEQLSEFSGDIIIAFDNDPDDEDPKKGRTGQKNTLKLRDFMRDHGFTGKIYDFTGAFVKQHPQIDYKDANKYWIDHKRKISIFETLQDAPCL